MRIPQQVSERVKEAPAQALRAVFSGIGQVLLVADRLKSRTAEPERARTGQAEPVAQAHQAAPTTVKDETRWRSLDETGNVRLLSSEDTTKAKPARTPPVAEPPAATEPPAGTAPVADTTGAADTAETNEATEVSKTAPAKQPAAKPAIITESSLPVPNYDTLTIPSLRARLRNLDPAQVRALLDYEKANAGRTDVLTMFERRIAKLESDGA